jgi:phage-related protein
MSVAEIKEELRRLTPEERREIMCELAVLEQGTTNVPSRAMSFAEAKAYVFENYGDLLRRLAQ